MIKNFTVVLSFFLLCSCSSHSEQKTDKITEGSQPAAEGANADKRPDILVPTKMEAMGKNEDNNPMSFAVIEETEDLITIEPTSWYYNDYCSRTRLKVPNTSVFEHGVSDYLHYPRMSFYIENNTEEPLTISSLDICVAESAEDPFPYLLLLEDPAINSSLQIWNEAWSDWGQMNLSYSLLKRGEPFNGKYERQITIPYFEDKVCVDFYEDAVGKGWNDISSHCVRYDEDETPINESKCKVVGRNCSTSHLKIGLLPAETTAQDADKLSYPFEYGSVSDMHEDGDFYIFARVYGHISFTKSEFTKDFQAVVYLTSPWQGGAGLGVSDNFDVQLKPIGKDYKVSFPYSTTIAPNRSEKIQLVLKCPKSAIHHFSVVFNNENDLNIRTKNISFHYINSRHSTKQREAQETFGVGDY